MMALIRFLRRFRRNDDGLSAIEFAFVAPIMIMFYFGMAELSQAFMVQRRVQHIASATADLVSQNRSVNDTKMTDVFKAGPLIMAPFATTGTKLQQRITSVTANASGVAKVDWSVGSNMTALAANATVTVPANLIAAGESVVMSEVTYAYTPSTVKFVTSPMSFSQTYYLRPRIVDKVTKTTG
jgi:Flp pilus assembly protein TadG